MLNGNCYNPCPLLQLFMSRDVFLVPFDYPNFRRTVHYPEFTGADLPEDFPEALRTQELVRIWGVRDGSRNRNQFERMDKRDGLLFYNNGQYRFAGRVGEVFEHDWIANTFWGHAPSRMLYSVDDFDQIRLPRSTLNDLLEYSADWYPQGFQRVADDRRQHLINRYGTFSEFVEDFQVD